jgi:hypothetical protein
MIGANDGKNVVAKFTFVNPAAGAKVIVTGGYLPSSGCVEKYRYFTDVDIAINESVLPSQAGGWPGYQTRSRNVLKHELGHAHCLNHAIDPFNIDNCEQSIMYYTADNCSSSILIKPNDTDGARTVFNRSQNIENNCLPSSIYSKILDNGCNSSSPTVGKTVPVVGIEPNPNYGEFQIFVPFEEDFELNIYNLNGLIMAPSSYVIAIDGKFHKVIAHNWNAGTYIVRLTASTGVIYYSRFVKI